MDTTHWPIDISAQPVDLDKNVVLVTGAAGGIGSSVCLACAAAGATVVMLDKNQRGLNRVYDQIMAENYPEPVQVVDDLAKMRTENFDVLTDQVLQEFKKLDGLVHCAATSAPLTPMQLCSPEIFESVLQVNVTSAWQLTRSTLIALQESSNACVVFCSGEPGRKGEAYWNASAVSWAAIDSMARTWHQELETNSNIRIYSLDPGAVNSPMRTRLFPAENPSMIHSTEEVARACTWLMSQNASNVREVMLRYEHGILRQS